VPRSAPAGPLPVDPALDGLVDRDPTGMAPGGEGAPEEDAGQEGAERGPGHRRPPHGGGPGAGDGERAFDRGPSAPVVLGAEPEGRPALQPGEDARPQGELDPRAAGRHDDVRGLDPEPAPLDHGPGPHHDGAAGDREEVVLDLEGDLLLAAGPSAAVSRCRASQPWGDEAHRWSVRRAPSPDSRPHPPTVGPTSARAKAARGARSASAAAVSATTAAVGRARARPPAALLPGSAPPTPAASPSGPLPATGPSRAAPANARVVRHGAKVADGTRQRCRATSPPRPLLPTVHRGGGRGWSGTRSRGTGSTTWCERRRPSGPRGRLGWHGPRRGGAAPGGSPQGSRRSSSGRSGTRSGTGSRSERRPSASRGPSGPGLLRCRYDPLARTDRRARPTGGGGEGVPLTSRPSAARRPSSSAGSRTPRSGTTQRGPRS